MAHQVYEFTLDKPQEKSGELFVGVDKSEWDKMWDKIAKPYAEAVRKSTLGRNFGRTRSGLVNFDERKLSQPP